MELRSQTLACAFLSLSACASELHYDVRHDHWLRAGQGTLRVSPEGVRFKELRHRKHRWSWRWENVQQLTIAARTIRVLTYEDVRLKLGRDREHRFDLIGPGDFREVWRLLRERCDVRLVAALADPAGAAEWRVAVKLLERFGGVQGSLVATAEGLTFQADLPDRSRTWRWCDLENVSQAGPSLLTVTTLERALADYGGLKNFAFQLRQALPEDRFHRLWERIHAGRGLKLIADYMKRSEKP
jgi:hypothetical protein